MTAIAAGAVFIETRDERFTRWRWTADRLGFLRAAPPADGDASQAWLPIPAGSGRFLLRNAARGGVVTFGGIDRELAVATEAGSDAEWSLDPASPDWQLIVHAHHQGQATDLYAGSKLIGTWPLHWEPNQWWRVVPVVAEREYPG